MSTSRKTARKALGALLKAGLEGTGKLAQVVYDYPPSDFTASPVVFTTSRSTRTQRQGIGSKKGFNRFSFDIQTWVIAPKKGDPDWTPSAAADALDDIEAVVRQIILDNPTGAAWAHLEIPDGAETEILHLSAEQGGGTSYDVEIIPVEVEVYDQ